MALHFHSITLRGRAYSRAMNQVTLDGRVYRLVRDENDTPLVVRQTSRLIWRVVTGRMAVKVMAGLRGPLLLMLSDAEGSNHGRFSRGRHDGNRRFAITRAREVFKA
jgi:hypothetical protein